MPRPNRILAAAALALTVVGAATLFQAQTPEFGRRVSFLSSRQAVFGLQTWSVDAADFNRDGYDDLVVMDEALVVLLLSDGEGNFSPPLLHRRGGAEAQQVIARDFNEDGNPDVAVVYKDGSLWVYLGDGQGGLSNGQSVTTGGSLTSLAAVDFDADGSLDIAVAFVDGSGNGAAQLMRNDGEGNFASAGPPVAAGFDPTRVAAADFDGDGHADIAVTNYGAKAVSVLYGDGMGGLTDPATLPIPAGSPPPFAVVTGDLNGDGLPDLLIGNERPGFPQQGTGALFLNDGGRRFAAPMIFSIPNAPEELRLVDINKDGHLDIAAGGPVGLVTLLNRGDGTFVQQAQAPVLIAASALTVGDFNGDGLVDYALAGLGTRVDIFLGQRDGTITLAPSIHTEPNPELGSQFFQPQHAVAADVNKDGIWDLVTTTGLAGTIVTFLGRGDGNFSPPLTSIVRRQTTWFAVADFDGDGILDVALNSSDYGRQAIDVLSGDGRGHFSLGHRVADEAEYGQLAVADLDGDGEPDLVAVARHYDVGPGTAGADIFANRHGVWQETARLAAADRSTVGVLLADLNRDGYIDVALVNSINLSVFLGNGDATFDDEIRVPAGVEGAIESAALGDLDEDGTLDLVVSQAAPITTGPRFGNFWLHGDGQGRFVNPIYLTPEQTGLDTQGSFVGAVAIADFNGDGHADIAVGIDVGAIVLQGDGRGNFAYHSSFFALDQACDRCRPLTVADFNGDGLPDITTPSQLFTGPSPAISFTLLFNTTSLSETAAGDANCDRRVDATDVAALTRRLFSPLYLVACRGADANGDGRVTAADLAALLGKIGM